MFQKILKISAILFVLVSLQSCGALCYVTGKTAGAIVRTTGDAVGTVI